jgi:hypothetical protein
METPTGQYARRTPCQETTCDQYILGIVPRALPVGDIAARLLFVAMADRRGVMAAVLFNLMLTVLSLAGGTAVAVLTMGGGRCSW